jgi:hypothetical protein
MDDFQKENAAKAAAYKENVSKIAEYLYAKFCHLEVDDYYDPEMEMIEKGRCADKATRLYQFFNSVEDIKRMMDFINTVNPGLARDLVDGL